MPVGTLGLRSARVHERRDTRCVYTLGCYLVAIRPRMEGRIYMKEYVFDKTGDEGRGVFCPCFSTPKGLYLNHVCEVMNETEWGWSVAVM